MRFLLAGTRPARADQPGSPGSAPLAGSGGSDGSGGSGDSGGSGGSGDSAGSGGELALAVAAHRVVAAAAWYGWLRRWGLLLSFGLAGDPVAEVRACLVVLASDDQAAERLAAQWGTVSGYRVAVLALTGEDAR